MMMDLGKIRGWVTHYASLQGVGDYRFDVSIVPGLTHEGADAWAVVQPDPGARTAIVQVRDIYETPIPGFDGDPLFEIRVTLSHEIFHVLLAEWIANPTVENEERVVESAAQAVVRSEFGADARVVARSIKAMPTAIRARVAVATKVVSARARSRARGDTMDQEQVQGALDALEADDAAKTKQILKEILAALAVKGAGGGGEAGGDMPPARDSEPAAGPPGAPMPDARAYGREEQPTAARARGLDAEVARARKAADGAAAMLARGRVRELRADGFELDAALERELIAERDPDVLERRISDLSRGRKMGAQGQQRARSGVQSDGAPPPASGEPKDPEDLKAFPPEFQETYRGLAKSDPKSADVWLSRGRATRAREAERVAVEQEQRARGTQGRN